MTFLRLAKLKNDVFYQHSLVKKTYWLTTYQQNRNYKIAVLKKKSIKYDLPFNSCFYTYRETSSFVEFSFETCLTEFCALEKHLSLRYGELPDIHCVKSVRMRSFSSPYFPAFWMNRERYGVSLRIQFECG